MVILGAKVEDREQAIRQSGELLVSSGCVPPSYVEGMLARERTLSTYVGHGIAIPHGELADLRSIYRTGVSVLQIPEGVEWERAGNQPGEHAYLVIGLATTGYELGGMLANLVELLNDPEIIAQLVHTTDPMVIVEKLTQGGK